MIENLKNIKKNSISRFLENEEKIWKCPECGGVICCHKGICFNCNEKAAREGKSLNIPYW